MTVETIEYLGAARRFIRGAGKRVAHCDEPELIALAALHTEVDQALNVAVAGWREMGRSWTDVGRALGISRQGAFQRFGRKDEVAA